MILAGLDRRGPVACTRLLTVVAILLILVTLPLSLVFVVKVSWALIGQSPAIPASHWSRSSRSLSGPSSSGWAAFWRGELAAPASSLLFLVWTDSRSSTCGPRHLTSLLKR